jgi:glycosyltransferase involved in cell wall biosynthesis
VDRLLRVVSLAKRHIPDLHLWIVGEGPARTALEHQVRELRLDDSVRFMGTRSDVASYLNAADIVALTSDTEGMPGVVLEAGFLGRTVVSTRVGGVSECVLNGETGLLVEPGDENGFARALETLFQNPDTLVGLGNAARTRVERHFTIGHIAPQYVRFYEQVLSR